MTMGVLLFVSLLGIIMLGVPICFALGVSVLLGLLTQGITPQYTLISQRMVSGLDSFTLMAIPFFILAGNLMDSGGISSRLVAFIKILMRKVPAASAAITTVASAFFGAISGSSPATVAAIGGIMIPNMLKEGYEREDAAAIAGASGFLGVIIPPSIPMVTYAVVAGVSVSTMFMAGIIPGVLLAMVMVLVSEFKYHKVEKISQERLTIKEFWNTFVDAIFALGMPLIILGGIYGGVFTPTEAAAVACVYSLVIAIYVYKDIGWTDVPGILAKSAKSSAAVLVIIGFASSFAWLMTSAGVPGIIAQGILSFTNRFVIFLLINLFLLFLGCFMETQSIILIVTPILLPIANSFGMPPIALGIIIVVNTGIGMITPPMAPNIYVANEIAKTNNVGKASLKVLPYLFACVLVLLLITYIPDIQMWLPRALGMTP